MNFFRNVFHCRFFKTNSYLMFFYNYDFPLNFCFGTFLVFAFGFSSFFLKYKFFLPHKKEKKLENVIKNNISYEDKYNELFVKLNSIDENSISSEKIQQKVSLLTNSYYRDLYLLQEEYSEITYINDDDSDDNDFSDEEVAKTLSQKICNLQLLLKNEEQIKNNALNQCLNDVKENLMNSLQNNFILENTPIGNVVMVYNLKKEGFSYYSDKSISNKYLESVCKKYCIQFNCKILFNNVFINEGKLSNFKFIKNEVKNNFKKNAKLSFRSFKEQFPLF